jgi:type IV secretion system protein VirD4
VNPRTHGVDGDLVNLGLILVTAAGLLATFLRLAGTVAAWLSGAAQPTNGWESGFRVLNQPGQPSPGAGH